MFFKIFNKNEIIVFKDCPSCGSLIMYNETFPIVWGHYSILEADQLCMHRLLQEDKGWFYKIYKSYKSYKFYKFYLSYMSYTS
jgi:hypothetical protein